MAEYIERKTVIDHLTACMDTLWKPEIAALEHFVEGLPAADVAPVVHTRWAHIGGDEWCCPVCGFVITTEGSWDKPTKKYCEDCGAKMDGGDDDAAN